MDDAMGVVQKWVSDIVNQVQKEADECSKEAAAELIPEIELGLELIYHRAVEKWYGSYTPRFYGRNGSLFNLMNIESDVSDVANLSLEYIFSDSNMTSDRAGNSLFDKVFIHGWHGGAYDSATGTIRYRTPYPGFFEWGRKAVKTPSVYFLFEKEKKNMEETYSKRLSDMTLAKLKERFA